MHQYTFFRLQQIDKLIVYSFYDKKQIFRNKSRPPLYYTNDFFFVIKYCEIFHLFWEKKIKVRIKRHEKLKLLGHSRYYKTEFPNLVEKHQIRLKQKYTRDLFYDVWDDPTSHKFCLLPTRHLSSTLKTAVTIENLSLQQATNVTPIPDFISFYFSVQEPSPQPRNLNELSFQA